MRFWTIILSPLMVIPATNDYQFWNLEIFTPVTSPGVSKLINVTLRGDSVTYTRSFYMNASSDVGEAGDAEGSGAGEKGLGGKVEVIMGGTDKTVHGKESCWRKRVNCMKTEVTKRWSNIFSAPFLCWNCTEKNEEKSEGVVRGGPKEEGRERRGFKEGQDVRGRKRSGRRREIEESSPSPSTSCIVLSFQTAIIENLRNITLTSSKFPWKQPTNISLINLNSSRILNYTNHEVFYTATCRKNLNLNVSQFNRVECNSTRDMASGDYQLNNNPVPGEIRLETSKISCSNNSSSNSNESLLWIFSVKEIYEENKIFLYYENNFKWISKFILLKNENSTSYAKCDEGVYEAFFSIQNVDLNRTWNYFIGLGMGIMIISCFLMWAVITYMKPQFCKKRKVYDPKEVTSPNSDFEQSVENPSFDVFSLKTVNVDDSIFVDNDLYASTESLPAFDNTEKIDKTPNLTEWTNEEDLEQNKGFCQKPDNLLSNQREDYIKEIKQVIQTKNHNAKSMSRGTSYGSDEYDVVDITDVEEVEDVYDNLEEITANPSCSDSQPEVKMNPTPNIQNSLNQNLGLTTNESIFVENEIYGDFEEIRSKDDSKVKRMEGKINRNKTFDNQSIRNDVSKKEIIPSCEFQITKEQKKNSILQKFKKIVLKSKKHDKVRNISIGDSIGDCSNYDMIELKEDVKKIMNNPIYNDPEVIRKSQIRFSSSTNKKPMGPEPQTDKFKAGEEEFFDNSIYDDPEYLIEEIEDLPTDFRGNVLSTKHANISLMNNKLETKHHGEMPAKSLDQYKLGKEISTLDYETIDFKDHDPLRKLENSSSTFKESGSGDDDKKDREEESDVFVNNCLYEDTKEMVLDKNRYSIPCVTTSPEYEDNYSDMVKEGSLYNSLVGDQEESLYYSLVGDQAGDIILENQERNLILGEKDHVVPGQFLSPKKGSSIQDDYTSITDEAGEEYFDNPIYQVRNSYLDSHNIDFTDSKKFKPPSEEEKSNPDEVMDNMLYEGTEDVLPERQLNHKEEENVDSKSSLRLYQISPMDKELIPSYEKKVEPFAYVPDNVTLKEQKNPADDEKDYPYASTSNSQKCLSLFPNRLESSFEKGSTDDLFYKKPGEMMQNSNKHSLDFEIMDDVYANPLIIQRNSSSTSEKSVGDRHHQEEGEGGEEIEGGGEEGKEEEEGEEEIEEERKECGEEGEEEREEERKEGGEEGEEEREEGGGEEIEEERKEEEREEGGGEEEEEGEEEGEEREEGGGEETEEERKEGEEREEEGGEEREEEGEEEIGEEEKENGERVVVEEENQQKGKQERETEEKEEEKSKEEKVEKEEEEEEEKKIREGDIEKEDKDLEEKKVEEEGKEEREQAENKREEER